MSGHVSGMPRLILRLEGAAVFIASVIAYRMQGAGWMLAVAALFLPDLFMVGYLRSSSIGAWLYNVGHSYVAPLALTAIAVLQGGGGAAIAACIWFAHIGMDRAMGYGLKYPDAFTNTHMGRIGSR